MTVIEYLVLVFGLWFMTGVVYALATSRGRKPANPLTNNEAILMAPMAFGLITIDAVTALFERITSKGRNGN